VIVKKLGPTRSCTSSCRRAGPKASAAQLVDVISDAVHKKTVALTRAER
jgi:hypothetical protein